MARVEPVYLSLVAVAGTLLGAAVTHVLQNRQVNVAARAAATERLRQERIAVYSAYLDAVTTFGSRQILCWRALQAHGPDSAEHAAALVADHEARAVARAAGYRLTLIADDEAVVEAADALMAAALAVLDAADREAFSACTEAVRTASRAFVTAARSDLRQLT
jgi:hypothetical protein